MKQLLESIKQGFTLVETLVNMLIVSVVTVSMFFVFNQINDINDLEMNIHEIEDYANNVLDIIVKELRRTTFLEDGQSSSNIITTITTSNETEIIFDLNNGVKRNDSTLFNYNPIDNAGRKKYKMHNFAIESVGVELGDIISIEASEARDASRELLLEVLIYTKYEQITPHDTLYFKRRVFCPGLLIRTNTENS